MLEMDANVKIAAMQRDVTRLQKVMLPVSLCLAHFV